MAQGLLLGADAMIQETSSMDQIVSKGPGISRKTKLWMAMTGGLVIAVVLLWPAVKRWARAEQSVDLSRLQIATVVRGDLERDVSAQGRVVAANHPKLSSRSSPGFSLWSPSFRGRTSPPGSRTRRTSRR
jgi:HlyD family secretion protein